MITIAKILLRQLIYHLGWKNSPVNDNNRWLNKKVRPVLCMIKFFLNSTNANIKLSAFKLKVNSLFIERV